MKVVAWELVEDNEFKKIPEIKAPEPKKEETKTATATTTVDLSNDASMKMIVMISTIEDELNVTIEIQEASNLNTIGDFVSVVRERL